MREKPIFEEVSKQLVCQPEFWVKLLIGGGLSFIPFANIFAFGYLYRFSAQLRRTGKIMLPDWHDWSGLFSDGLKFSLVWIVYWFLPLLLAGVLARMFFSLGLLILAYLTMTAMILVASVFFSTALYRFHMKPDYRTLLQFGGIVRMVRTCLETYVLSLFVFTGIVMLVLPLYGVAFFIGFLFLITQLNLCYRSLELRK